MADSDTIDAPERVLIQGAVDSQELKQRVEQLIRHIAGTGPVDNATVHALVDEALWDFVGVVYERSLEPCLHDICERLFRLNSPT